MLNDWIQKGLVYSQNPAFRKYMGKASGLLAKPVKLGILLTTAYGKLVDSNSPKGSFEQIKEIMQTFIRLVRAYVSGDYRHVAKKSILIGVAVLLYLVTPLDIIPDFIPGIGLLDDLSLMAWFVTSFQREIENFRAWEADTSYAHIGSF
ncbi:YkvA family protein [Pontibacter liquoris]|uniref:YkvA family protein n=1 Tax=Pontibacter liquoris TaxID=2905677 RepID=UPI001FA7C864|nr:YkvA family protein [Pontibacter liquoris]